MKDTDFYDKESGIYSIKRYPEVPISYTQFFFRERLRLVMKILRDECAGKTDLSLLEIGCADGVVLGEIHKDFPITFSSLVGIDISPKMIEIASKKYPTRPFAFRVREDFSNMSAKDVILEIGVINYTDLSDEFDFAYSRLKKDSIYIISLAGADSLLHRIKGGDEQFRNFLSYREYEKKIKERFEIVRTVPVGLFMPLIWKWPAFGRSFQPLEKILRPFSPNLFHEKIYLVKKI